MGSDYMSDDNIREIVKQYLGTNLRLEITKETEWLNDYERNSIKVVVLLDDDEIYAENFLQGEI
jgi:acyl carrier protein